MAAGDGYYSVHAKNLMLDAVAAVAGYVSAHTSSPGSTGANECAGSVRQVVTWATAAGGSASQTNTPTISGIDGTDTVQFLGLWDAGGFGAGSYLGRIEVTPVTGPGSGTWSYACAAGTIDLNSVASA